MKNFVIYDAVLSNSRLIYADAQRRYNMEKTYSMYLVYIIKQIH